MPRLRAILLPVAVVVLAACQAATVAPSASPVAAVPTPSPSAAPTPSPTAAPTSSPPPKPTPLAATPVPSAGQAVPPPPTAVKISFKTSDPDNVGYDAVMTTTISWKEAQMAGTEIRVYGVTACLPPEGQDPAPCLVVNTPLPASVRELITKAPAANGKVSWSWPNWEDVGGAVADRGDTYYYAFVIAAYNSAGHSKFVIVRSGEYCSDCTY